ncbi:hypothetical protein [Streptomyces sp. NPDC127084]|uniref:hypothetical protein n=1 Tax=Streptomyces sp. NPDC127084 TaxID=3347133 RepID=UPI0036502AFC
MDDFHEMTRAEVMRHLEAEGPEGLINRTRAMEKPKGAPADLIGRACDRHASQER